MQTNLKIIGFLITLPCVFVAICCGQNESITTAQTLLLSGRHAESLEVLEKASLSPEEKLAAQFINLDICFATGQREIAAQLFELLEADAPPAPGFLHRKIQFALNENQIEVAQKHWEMLAKLHPDEPTTRWLQIEILLQQGAYDSIPEKLKWFPLQEAKFAEYSKRDDAVATQLALARGLYEHARWNREAKWFSVAVNTVLGNAQKEYARDYRIPALRAEIFAAQHNAPAALEALQNALALNASAWELHALQAELAIAQFDVTSARQSIAQGKQSHAEAWQLFCLEADCAFAELQVATAKQALDKIPSFAKSHAEVAGRMYVATEVAQGMSVAEEQKQAFTGNIALFLQSAGHTCDLMRRIEHARENYAAALQAAPNLPGLRHLLAEQLLRLNENEKALVLLEIAQQEDPFNVRLKNTLAVLEVLRTYAQIESEHFIVRFDRGRDDLLAHYVSEYMEQEVYPALVKRFGFAPAEKSVIELYSRARNTSGHGWFSARMVGLPGLHTIGACSGKVVALASPTDMPQPYNWARVLRHEFVHRLNLEQTHFQIQHWVTEGMAVDAEERPRPSDWMRLVARRAHEKKLFTLYDINFGFIRPTKSDDRTLAYAQADLYIKFLREKYGAATLPALLTALGKSQTNAQAIEQVTKQPLATFEQEYAEFVQEQIAQWNLQQVVGSGDIAALKELLKKEPNNAEITANLAVANLDSHQILEAQKYALQALEHDSQSQAAGYVLAALAYMERDFTRAEQRGLKALNLQQPHFDLLLFMTKIKISNKQFAVAEKLALLGKKHYSLFNEWNELLRTIYEKTKQEEKLYEVLESIAHQTENDISPALTLAEQAWKQHDLAKTEQWSKAALQIDVKSTPAHALLANVYYEQGKYESSLREFAAGLQDNSTAEFRARYARVALKQGQRETAKKLVEGLIKSHPDYAGLIELAREVDQP